MSLSLRFPCHWQELEVIAQGSMGPALLGFGITWADMCLAPLLSDLFSIPTVLVSTAPHLFRWFAEFQQQPVFIQTATHSLALRRAVAHSAQQTYLRQQAQAGALNGYAQHAQQVVHPRLQAPMQASAPSHQAHWSPQGTLQPTAPGPRNSKTRQVVVAVVLLVVAIVCLSVGLSQTSLSRKQDSVSPSTGLAISACAE
jgi:hypothetical protein